MPYKFKVFILTLLSIPLLLTEATIAEVKTSEIEELKSQILEIQKQHQMQIEQLLQKIESLENNNGLWIESKNGNYRTRMTGLLQLRVIGQINIEVF